MIERTDSDWRALHNAYKRRFTDAKCRGVLFTPTADEKEAHRLAGAAYAATANGRAVLRAGQRKYKQSKHGLMARNAYNRSEARKASGRRYAHTPKGRTSALKARAKHRGHAPPEHIELDRLVYEQGNTCAICRVSFAESRKPRLDHCHLTGAVRGALCDDCNLGLGLFRDDPVRLENAAKYVALVATPAEVAA